MSLLIDTIVGQRGQTNGHIQRTCEVLTQGNTVLRVTVVIHQSLFNTRDGLGHAQTMSHFGSVIRAILQVALQANKRGVQRLLQGLVNREDTTAGTTGVVQSGVTGLDRRRRVLRGQRNALIERCGQRKNLESRTGLQTAVRVVPTSRIVATVVGADSTGLWLHRNDGGTQTR